MLSGFVIAYSASQSRRHFLLHRLIRVLPPYWIATSLGLALILLAMPLPAALDWFGRSLVFVTGPNGRPDIIFVAWTLVYELAFYLVYALALALWPRAAPFLAALVLLFLAYGLNRIDPGWRTWPLLVEFVYGLAIFVIVSRLEPGERRGQGAGSVGPASDRGRTGGALLV